MKDTISRRFMCLSSSSMGEGPCRAAGACFPAGRGQEAPYPASATAASMAWGEVLSGSYSTVMELDSRFTLTSVTPSNFRTALSTWAEQAEQVMPVTSNFCFKGNTTLSKKAPPIPRRVARPKHFAEQNLDAGGIHFRRADRENGVPAGRHVLWGTEQAEQVMPVTSNFCFKGNTTLSGKR